MRCIVNSKKKRRSEGTQTVKGGVHEGSMALAKNLAWRSALWAVPSQVPLHFSVGKQRPPFKLTTESGNNLDERFVFVKKLFNEHFT